MLSRQVSIIDLLHHSVCIVVLVSNSPLVPASQEAVQDESKKTDAYILLTPYIVNVMFNGAKSLIITDEINTSVIHPPNNPLMLYGA